jgi:hypothetical protein
MHYDLRAPAKHRPRPLRPEQLRATALEHHEHHTVMADPPGQRVLRRTGPAQQQKQTANAPYSRQKRMFGS